MKTRCLAHMALSFILLACQGDRGAEKAPDLFAPPVSARDAGPEGHKIVVFKRGKGYFKKRSPCEAVVPVVTAKLDEYLERDNVPAVVYREIDGQKGILFEFLDNARAFSPPNNPGEGEVPAKLWAEKLSLAEYSDLQLVQYLSGAADRNLTNYMLKEDKVYAIDNDGDIMHFGQYPGWTFLFAYTESNMDFDFERFPFDKVKTQSRAEFLKEIAALYPGMEEHPLLDHPYRVKADEYTWLHWQGGVWIQKERNFYEPFSARVVLKDSLNKLRGLKRSRAANWIGRLDCPYKEFYLDSFMAKKRALLEEIKGENGYRLL